MRSPFFRSLLGGADLRKATLSGANFTKASLFATRLRDADLSGADLTGADLTGAQFRRTNVRGGNFSNARMRDTVMVALDLSEAQGLETITHRGPSSIGTDTMVLSKAKIPEMFLRGAGVPEPLILQVKSLKGYEFYSCFISYASADDKFVRRLYADLQSNHVRCWYAPEDLKAGDEFRQRIDEEIFGRDKLLLVLTEHSLKSPWVKKEVETAFEKEQKQKRTVLFPIQLDDAVLEATEAWAGDIRRMRHIGDFRGWKNRNKYQTAFRRLLHDLKSEVAKG